MKDLVQMKEELCRNIEENTQWAVDISKQLFEHPETSDKEFQSAAFLVEKMREAGFEAQYPYMNLDTAFSCKYGKGGARVAFLAEYDALPGYGENHDQAAHACGHNWIAASTALTAVSLAQIKELPGQVYYIGTPGEEVSGSKVEMADAGAFDQLDGVFQMHLDKDTSVDTVMLAMTDFVFEFFGKAAHAAGAPENGINALNACELTLAGINAMRQQLPPEVKIHAVYLDGGTQAGIIPDHASLSVYVRDASKDRLEQIIERLLNIGRGAELMTGATFRYQRAKNTYYDLKNDPQLRDDMRENLLQLGISDFVPGDKYHAVSSDIGNVSYRCPTCYCTMGVAKYTDARLHEEAFLDFADSSKAHELLVLAAKAMGMSALDVMYQEKQKKI